MTVLLFFAIPEELRIGKEFEGVLLFVMLVSCLIMTWALISYKNKLESNENLEKVDDLAVNNETDDQEKISHNENI